MRDHGTCVAGLGIVADEANQVEAGGDRRTEPDGWPPGESDACCCQQHQRGEDHDGRTIEGSDVHDGPDQCDCEESEWVAAAKGDKYERADTGGHVGPAGVEFVRASPEQQRPDPQSDHCEGNVESPMVCPQPVQRRRRVSRIPPFHQCAGQDQQA